MRMRNDRPCLARSGVARRSGRRAGEAGHPAEPVALSSNRQRNVTSARLNADSACTRPQSPPTPHSSPAPHSRPPERRAPHAPIFLYVGRVAVEKNIEAFLALDLPGSKWVAGEGPLLARLKIEHPGVRFTGVLGQRELASLYNAADVFVFPSRTDTFGLVLLEALACGCPVAAYPVTGPIDVIGDVRDVTAAGALDDDLRTAALRALTLDRRAARAHAERFSWEACTRQFLSHLHPLTGRRAASPDAVLGDVAPPA